MSDEKAIEYDFGSSLSFVNSLESICALMAGFVFTGTTVVLSTLVEPVTLLTQAVLFILSAAMGVFTGALWELHNTNILVCLQSPKLIIPNFPAKWRLINTYIFAGSLLEQVSINLLFLLRNMRELFALNTCISVLFFALMYFYSFRPLKEKMETDIKERLEKDRAKER